MLNSEDSSMRFTAAGADGDAGHQAYLNADQRGGTSPNGKPSKTIDQAGLHLVGGEPGWSSALGVAYNVTYAFRSTAPSSMPSDTGGFSRFNAAQITQAEQAMLAWSDVANITFTRVGSGTSGEGAYSNSASILLANYSSGEAGAAAFGNYPGDPSYGSESGDVWVNSTLSYNLNPTPGGYGALVLVHELGHAIGLAHPGDYNADSGVEITYAHDAEYYEDSTQYTVMSYFDETDTGADYHGAYAASPMLDDISAAQQEYGVNLTTRTGDTVYGFNSTAGRAWYLATSASTKLIFAVWDAGGNDTLDFSGYGVAQTVELREGFFSSVGGLVGNVAIAKGAAIENAIGGSGIDTITGNPLANRLEGRGGNDILDGQGGDDVLDGGVGADTLIGGTGADTVTYASSAVGVTVDLAVTGAQTGAGSDVLTSIEYLIGSNYDDVLWGDSAGNALFGDNGADWLSGRDGVDVLFGGLDRDTLSGGTGDDRLMGEGGDDVLEGGTGADILDGGDGVDLATYGSETAGVIVDLAVTGAQAGAGRDQLSNIEYLVGSNFDDVLSGNGAGNALYGGAGADRLSGLDGVDVLFGGLGRDTLSGGTGNDLLVGEGDDDVLDGGAGADTLDGGDGVDMATYVSATAGVIVDLSVAGAQAGAGLDVLTNIEYLSGSNFDDVLSGNGAGNALYGGEGADQLNGQGGVDVLFGGGGRDILSGGADNDLLMGEVGDDILDGGAAADTLNGGDGADTASYASATAGVVVDLAVTGAQTGADRDVLISIEYVIGSNFNDQLFGDGGGNALYGGGGGDRLNGLGGVDVLFGGAGDDTLSGGDGQDLLLGEEGNDLLDGGAGADTLDGGGNVDTVTYVSATAGVTVDLAVAGAQAGAGGDVLTNIEYLIGSNFDDVLSGSNVGNALYGGDGADQLSGRGGGDVVYGGAGADTLLGGDEGDLLRGEAGDDVLDGGAGDDNLYGGDGFDTLIGGDGNDVLYADEGRDFLTGGAGDDRFIIGAGSNGWFWEHVITDFGAGGDHDQLRIDGATSWMVTQVGADTVIVLYSNGHNYDPGADLTLVGFDSAHLQYSDGMFMAV